MDISIVVFPHWQYLNIKLIDISVPDPDKYPHLVSRLAGSWGWYWVASFVLFVVSSFV